MPSGIQEHDKGYLAGSEAWHHDERYIITGTRADFKTKAFKFLATGETTTEVT